MSNMILRYGDLKKEHGIPWTRQYIDRLVKAGDFPPKVALGKHTVGWRESDIIDWKNGRPVIGVQEVAAHDTIAN